ncbi:unnamed protein product [Lathyrus sativus]|nr:unnamed protein product [Lathyrus sativus]
MAKKKRVKSVYLPHELIMEILLRLPVKTLLCCRFVCKSWFSLISDNNFATSHCEHAATHRLVLINGFDLKSALSIDVDASLHDSSAHASLTLDFLSLHFPYEYSLEIKGSCRGFLFMLFNGKYLYLWNPSTGVNKQIPDSFINTFTIMVSNFSLALHMTTPPMIT